MNLLLTGSEGQLGRSLLARSESTPGWNWICADLPDFDISDPKGCTEKVLAVSPDLVINCAAYTAVDQAETEKERAFAVNGSGPGHLASACRQLDIPLIHISTDYVFAGTSERPYLETDPPGPVSVYGRSKLSGEQAVLTSGCRGLVVRTSWLYSEYGRNFFLTMARLAEGTGPVSVVNDQTGTPTYAGDLAEIIIRLAQWSLAPGNLAGGADILHVTNSGAATWFGFASEIFRLAGSGTPLKPVTSSEYPSPVRRPAYSVLDNGKLTDLLGVRPRNWQEALADCFRNFQYLTDQKQTDRP